MYVKLSLAVNLMKLISRFLALTLLFGLFSLSWANDLDKARKTIMSQFNGIKAENIQPSAIKGLYRVTLPPRVFYVSADGRYVVDGDVIDLSNRQNITREYRRKSLLGAIDAMGEDSMIVFSPKHPKHTVTVFTDIDCAYCRKLHNSIDEYNKLGIKIRYMAYPRAGIGSESYNKAVSTWCADDRKKALTRAKNDLPIESKTCDNPVAEEYQLGNMIGISGTPALVLESGRVIPGYVPPKQLAAILDDHMQQSKR